MTSQPSTAHIVSGRGSACLRPRALFLQSSEHQIRKRCDDWIRVPHRRQSRTSARPFAWKRSLSCQAWSRCPQPTVQNRRGPPRQATVGSKVTPQLGRVVVIPAVMATAEPDGCSPFGGSDLERGAGHHVDHLNTRSAVARPAGQRVVVLAEVVRAPPS